MADTTFRTILPPTKAVDNLDGTHSLAVAIQNMDALLDDTPVNGETGKGITSNWAYDHAADTAPHANLITQGMVQFIPFVGMGTVGQGTWGNYTRNDQSLDYCLENTTIADGDNISFEIYLDKGTYTLHLLVAKSADAGILDVDIGPTGGTLTEVATVDLYAASPTWNQILTQASISITTAGRKTIRLRAHGKNASSSAYHIYMTTISLWRTA